MPEFEVYLRPMRVDGVDLLPGTPVPQHPNLNSARLRQLYEARMITPIVPRGEVETVPTPPDVPAQVVSRLQAEVDLPPVSVAVPVTEDVPLIEDGPRHPGYQPRRKGRA